MPTWLQILIAAISSSGLWTFLATAHQKKMEKKSISNRMLLGLAHDRIIWLCEKYIDRGWISTEEFENLHDYLYIPYKEMGGNGSAERLMNIVKTLPIKTPSNVMERQIKMDI